MENGHRDLVFGSFSYSSDSDLEMIHKPKNDGSTFKVGEITCFFNSNSSCNPRSKHSKVEEPAAKVEEVAKNEPIADLSSSITFDLVSDSNAFDRRHAVVNIADSDCIVSGLTLNRCSLLAPPPPWFVGEQKRQILIVESHCVLCYVKASVLLENFQILTPTFAVESHVWPSDFPAVRVATVIFDPGGTITWIYYSAIVLLLLSSSVQAKNLSRVSVFIFDHGRNRHCGGLIARSTTFGDMLIPLIIEDATTTLKRFNNAQQLILVHVVKPLPALISAAVVKLWPQVWSGEGKQCEEVSRRFWSPHDSLIFVQQ